MPEAFRVSYGESAPCLIGWHRWSEGIETRGWSDTVAVYLDGVQVGQLVAVNCCQKRWMTYRFTPTWARLNGVCILPSLGLRLAKVALESEIAARLRTVERGPADLCEEVA